ncbi:hypothetical protein [Microvirga brassicacearum]|uniref:DUF2147 domain-containing protein n=1 Tax=Microvirga brassicacearum TaxID=2580413 RepID=A0A5N3PHD9_9HYPH|nr:hypothetical protein [Microvirga brassicacearum]KAB0269134.1 hypothetical protein FEZ63_03225 [Microvirga brassicacearum]
MRRVLASFFLAVTFTLINNAALAQQQFDGRWSVEAIPEKGACVRARRYAVAIENGTMRNAGRKMEKVNVSGGLEASGRIRGSIRRNKTQVDVTGNLSGRLGSGDWAIAGRVACSGRWTAEKKS